ncbi:DNA sulfur modification protein DndB [Bacterioplanoides sp. SCSIO 12839]|uniref:DNA sulfur modification protein DndB n=1 Tax=Bacterioplanoides sp. SCSIO 12839 TaxID=2829569 RepID=UPI0021062269|nr:DNA sulfur modification protein DndB [Bacterioplanoides sp. SCSIO 12839]
MQHEYSHKFPAVRGMQAGRPCYIAMCPMRLIPKLFVFDEDVVPPELRAQRRLNESRVPDIAQYLIENPSSYTLSAITASIDGHVTFEPLADTGPAINLGMLSIAMETQILVNDGQHRRAAIEQAVKEAHELGHDNIPVLFFVDDGLSRSQQMFADLNKHAVRPSDSLSTLYDQRDGGSALARYVYDSVPCFTTLTDLESNSLSKRSSKLFTLSSIKQASRTLLGKAAKDKISKEEMEVAAEYWDAVCSNMRDWQAAMERTISTSELRAQCVHAHGIGLASLGAAGSDLIRQYPHTWKSKLSGLREVDWSRSNMKLWRGRAMDNHGKLSKTRNNTVLTANVIRKALGVTLGAEEQRIEDQLNS